MKTLKQLREEYDSKYVSQNESPEEMVLEAKHSVISSDVPSFSKMPQLLIFRRVSYKLYPQKQTVALYYSKMVDKYLSVPFGPGGNVNLAESVVLDNINDLQEDHQSTETMNIKESFKSKLEAKRMQQNEDALDVATFLPGMAGNLASGASAIRNVRRGKYFDAAIDAAGAVDPTKVVTGVGISGLAKGAKLAKGLFAARKAAKGADVARDASAIAKSVKASKPAVKTATKEAGVASKLVGAATKGTSKIVKGAGMLGAALGALSGKGAAVPGQEKQARMPKPDTRPSTTWKDTPDAVTKSKIKTAEIKQAKAVKENKITDIRNMISEGVNEMDLSINGRSVTLNTNMAKRILEVYDSVNTKNKKIVESMLNEDLESFKKLLNFSIRN